MLIKPQLACDADLEKIVLPVIMMPKIDGVRGINIGGNFTGRSLKPHGNRFLRTLFSRHEFDGFDGELALSKYPITAEVQCRLTTSAVNSYEGEPDVNWYLFDFITRETMNMNYDYRLLMLHRRLEELKDPSADHDLRDIILNRIFVVPHEYAGTLEEVISYEKRTIELGFEGVILRAANRIHKSGRATIREGGYLRIKRFHDGDAIVLEVQEGRTNQNVATVNELGRTERSSHQENMQPNGQVGTLVCRDVETGITINVAPGCMSHSERRYYWLNQHEIVGKRIKFKQFKHGRKDAPRFPTFQALRLESDNVDG